ncbi:MAG: pantetheine-phosphate adenylyltransferase [Candidatus Curtissbacteria bacterium]
MRYKFTHLACGGTFDFLHKGHRGFLDFAFLNAAFVSIGITTDALAMGNGKNNVRVLAVRLAELKSYIKKKGFDKRSKVILLNDIYGNTTTDQTIDGILITADTIRGAGAVNLKRAELGLGSIAILEFPVVRAQDNRPISSERIRLGEIDRDGNSYILKISGRDWALPKELRSELSRPHGELFKDVDELFARIPLQEVICVGDLTTANFLKVGTTPRISIIDLKVGRKRVYGDITDLGFSAKQGFQIIPNATSTIKNGLVLGIDRSIHEDGPQVIKVLGEEDLAVLPATILAPLGWHVVYGQPERGLVMVTVTEKTKRDFLELLFRFKSS